MSTSTQLLLYYHFNLLSINSSAALLLLLHIVIISLLLLLLLLRCKGRVVMWIGIVSLRSINILWYVPLSQIWMLLVDRC